MTTGTTTRPPPSSSKGRSGESDRARPPPSSPSHTDDAIAAELSAARADPRRRVGRYLILAELGRGAGGVVYRAWDETLGRLVAIKRLRATGIGADLERFHREARAAARLDHPGIVGVIHMGELEGDPFIVMDYVRGDTLHRRLDEGIELSELLRVVRDVARALDHAHHRGITHRDVKPANILIEGEDGRARVTDFGLAADATATAQLTTAGETVGTPFYMAPEQVQGLTEKVGAATDVYALGVTLYEGIAGRRPFDAPSAIETFQKILSETPVRLDHLRPSVPRPLADLVERCLARDAHDRPASAGELADELDALIEGNRLRRGARAGSGAREASQRLRRRRDTQSLRRVPELPAGVPDGDGPDGGGLDPRVLAGAAVATAIVFAALGGWLVSGPDIPPRVTAAALLQPRDGDLVVETRVGVAGEVIFDREGVVEGAHVWVGGRRVAVVGGQFAGAVVLRGEDGPHPIEVRASPEGPILATRTVHLRRVPPEITLREPAADTIVGASAVRVAGRVEGYEVERIVVIVAGATPGVELPVVADGSFTGQVPLGDAEGSVELEVEATDGAGRTGAARRAITIDRGEPTLRIGAPAPGQVTRDAEVVVRGRVLDGSEVTVRVDGREVVVEPNGRFVGKAALPSDGMHEILVEATDAAGHTVRMRRKIERDATPPVVVIDEPKPGAVSGPFVLIRGHLEDARPAAVQIAGQQPVPVGPDGAFLLQAILPKGAQTLALTGGDAVGNAATVTIDLRIDVSPPPRITFAPAIPVERWGERRRISARGALDRDGCRVTVDGSPVEVKGRAFALEVDLAEGENRIVVVATDTNGKRRRAERVVTYHARKPAEPAPAGLWWPPTPEQRAHAAKNGLPLTFENELGMRFVLVPPGKVMMGSPPAEPGRRSDETRRQVTVTRGFYVAATEVTNAQFRRFRPKHDSGLGAGVASVNGEEQPVCRVPPADMRAFCAWLGKQAGEEGLYRLPTEAEWELAARAGTTSTYIWGDLPEPAGRWANGRPGHYEDDEDAVAAEVGVRLPNRFGLFDMIGNLCEMTSDHYAVPPPGPQTDPTGPARGAQWVARGGAWMAPPENLRSAARFQIQPGYRSELFGIRVVASRPPKGQ